MEIIQKKRRLAQMQEGKADLEQTLTMSMVGKASSFISHCSDINCKGHMHLSEDKRSASCSTCSSSVCTTCRASITSSVSDHTCTADDLASITLLSTTSKPCPNCCIVVHKFEGCNQITCNNCATVFDFGTGKVDNGMVHNEDAYNMAFAYVQQHGIIAYDVDEIVHKL